MPVNFTVEFLCLVKSLEFNKHLMKTRWMNKCWPSYPQKGYGCHAPGTEYPAALEETSSVNHFYFPLTLSSLGPESFSYQSEILAIRHSSKDLQARAREGVRGNENRYLLIPLKITSSGLSLGNRAVARCADAGLSGCRGSLGLPGVQSRSLHW